MSRENPTTEEIDAILQQLHGSYGIELPSWWPVPPEATEALGRALDARLDEILPKQIPEVFKK